MPSTCTEGQWNRSTQLIEVLNLNLDPSTFVESLNIIETFRNKCITHPPFCNDCTLRQAESHGQAMYLGESVHRSLPLHFIQLVWWLGSGTHMKSCTTTGNLVASSKKINQPPSVPVLVLVQVLVPGTTSSTNGSDVVSSISTCTSTTTSTGSVSTSTAGSTVKCEVIVIIVLCRNSSAQ
jgi:hypothetical protein